MPLRSSSRSSHARRPPTWTALCAVVPGLVLGFAAGVELARAGAGAQPTETPRAGAASRVIEVPPTHPSRARLESASGHVRPDAAVEGPAVPSRRSVQAEIQATDPEAWLSRFGEVHTASLEAHP